MDPLARPLRLLLLLAAAAGVASARSVHAEEASPDPAPDDGAVTVLGTGLLRQSRAVIRACVEKVAAVAAGVEIATVRVEETLWGEAPPGDRVRVLTHEAGYFARISTDAVLFLEPMGGGRYACKGVVDLAGDDGPPKLAALRRCLEVEGLPAEKRAAALRSSPSARAMVMVTPEREVPGISASACAQPISRAWCQSIEYSSLSRRPKRSASHMSSPNKVSVPATNSGLRSICSISPPNSSPAAPTGIVPMTTHQARRASGV